MKYFYQFKKTTKTALSVFVLATVIVIGIYACKKPNDGINLILDTGLLSKAPVLVQFTNANINSTTALPATFSVTITGTGAKYVQIDGGGTDFTANNGFLPLSLTKDAVPSPTNPITFNVYVTLPGFAPVSKTISITKDSLMNTTVPLVEYANPVDGTSVLVKSTTLTNGTALSTVLKTNATATLGQTATLTIPAGTQMLDASGNVISASQLNSNIVQYGTSNVAAVASIPGGGVAIDAIGPGGMVLPGQTNFVTAGTLSINMTADNTPVKKFSQPVQVSIDLPAGYINFDTGNPVAVGDVIPFWSQNEQTGLWTYEGTANVSAGTNGLIAKFAITHLTYWSLENYFYNNPNYPQNSHNICFNGVTFKFHPSTSNVHGTYYLLWLTSNGNCISQIYFYPSSSSILSVIDAPKIDNTKLYVYDSKHNLVGSSANIASCSSGTVDVNYTTPPVSDIINVSLNLTALCTNKQVVALPTGWVEIRDMTTNNGASNDAGNNYIVYVYNGTIYTYNYNQSSTTASNTIQLVNGHAYSMFCCYSGRYYSTSSFILNKTNIVIPQANGLSGTATYNAATNSVNIKASFTLTNCK